MNEKKPTYTGKYIPYFKSGYHNKLDLPPMTGEFTLELQRFFNENHDFCTSCHKHFQYGELTHLGYDSDRKLIYACNQCRGKVENTVVRYGYSKRAYQIPPNDAFLWRYMDFTKYVSLLSTKSLFFCSASNFNDAFEGARGLREYKDSYDESYIKMLATAFADRPEAAYDIIPTEKDIAEAKLQYEKMTEHRIRARNYTFLNCWHENEFESDAMWYLYSKDISNAIAIRTTYDRLCNGFKKDPNISIGRVNYIDFSKEFTNSNDEYWFKRFAFAHEREVRAIITRRDSEGQFGIQMNTELDILIEKVYISPKAPDWFVSLIADINFKFGINKEIIRSEIAKEPFF